MTTDAPSSNPTDAAFEMSSVAVGSMQTPDLPVLEDVEWRVDAGDYWVVAGMHGSGKSDFMMMTGGLMPAQRGCYRLFGHAMPIYDEALLPERLRLGLVFDGGHLLHRLTVMENFALPLQYHRNAKSAGSRRTGVVSRMLEETGLGRWAEIHGKAT